MAKTQTKKTIVGGFGILVGILGLALFALHILNERENNRHINQDIFPTFRSIEQSCREESFPNQTVRCQQVLQREKQCHDSGINGNPCSAEEYYYFLLYLGFRLPPFYEPEYTPK